MSGDSAQEVTVQIEPEDLAQAHRLNFRQYLRSRKAQVRLIILWVLATVVYAVITGILVDAKGAVLPVLVFAVIAPFAIVGIPFLIVAATSGPAARKAFGQQKGFHKPITVAWNGEGVSFEGYHGIARFKWTDFVQIRQDRHLILMYESERIYRVIPKRALSADQITNLQTAIPEDLLT
jgi:hypothetical protein